MKIIALYRPNSEFARNVEEYAHDFERQRGKTIKLVSLDTPEGSEMARLYDIVQYPALIALSNDGQLLRDWQGSQLPLMDEIAAYSDG
jgi:hypothetical protein